MNRIFVHDYRGSGMDPSPLKHADVPPPWRAGSVSKPAGSRKKRLARPMSEWQKKRGSEYVADQREAELVTASLILRRPLLVTGSAGVGKSSLAYSVAWQLGLGNVLRWNVTSRSTLKDALYEYDAVSRLHDVALKGDSKGNPERVGDYITLGPLGVALLPVLQPGYFPRVLLIDEIDKGDADLPSDLLHVLEEGVFEISEISRHSGNRATDVVAVRTIEGDSAEIPTVGRVVATDFPLVVMTSNGERDFPAAFKRRCIPLEVYRPNSDKLRTIVQQHLGAAVETDQRVKDLIHSFADRGKSSLLATDQLLNSIHLLSALNLDDAGWTRFRENLWRDLNELPRPEKS